jgi:hypothetical protein
MDAAIAAAAHRVLTALYPQQRDMLNQALLDSLAEVPNGGAEVKGIIYGRAAATRVLLNRHHDGSADEVEYVVNPAPGHWSADPLNPEQTALTPHWGSVDPFALLSGDQFAPPHPEPLTSAQYTAAFNEVKDLGGDGVTTPTSRTPDQTEIGIFWGYDRPGLGTPPALYNQIAQVIAQQENNTVVENARLFLLVNIAQADAGISSWDCKYIDDLWRPVTGIRRAAEDGNPETVADPTWTPLGAPGGGQIPNFTPPFPAYVSGHATFGAAVFRVLADFYGTDQMSFTIGSDELPGVTRSYTSFSQASAENARSRIYLGIHWNIDDIEGRVLGGKVADWVSDHVALPRGPHEPSTPHLSSRSDSPFGDHSIVRSASLIGILSGDDLTE